MLAGLRRRLLGSEAAFEPGRTLCFMHVPKCSGSSLILGIGTAISQEATGGFDRVLFGDFNAFESFSAAERRRIFDDPAALPAQADFVAGHFAYSTLRSAYPQAQLMTVLREPFGRVISLWMFWRKALGDDMSGVGLWADYVRLAARPLKGFLAEPRIAAQTDNQVVRQLLWPHPHIPLNGFIDPMDDRELLRLARRRLMDFAFSGVVEAVDLSAGLERFLARPFSYRRVNETDAIPAALRTPFAAELDTATLDLLEARSRLDVVLWSDAARLSPSMLARLRQQTILHHVARCSALMAS
jgi:hypothetical protein